MKLIKAIFERNKVLAYLGLSLFVISLCLIIYAPFNDAQILGINSMIKPIKFGLSTGIYAWTMAYLLHYVNNRKSVKLYTILAVATMVYENAVITVQAFRGQLSHFNINDPISGMLYGFMGIMITWLTTATLVIAIRFIRQKEYSILPVFALSIKIGLVLFVVLAFSED